MATVQTLMAAHPDPRIDVRIVATYADVSVLGRGRIGLRGMLVSTAAVLTGRVDLLHVHLAHGGSVLRKAVPLLAARLRGTATVVHEHSYDFSGWFDSLPRWARPLVRRGVAADRWLVLSAPHVDEFGARLTMPRDRILLLHNPVVLPPDDELAVQPAPGEPVLAVSLGRLGLRKGSYDIVAATALLPTDVRSRLRVVLAGDGEIDEVRAAIVAAGVADTIEVRGWQEPAERDALMRQAQVFLLPSHDEGLPMAMLEAMARGLAPVVTPVGGIPQVVRDGVEGLLVGPADPAALAHAMSRLVEDDALRVRLAETSRKRSSDFAVARWYADLSELWIGLVERRRPARRRR